MCCSLLVTYRSTVRIYNGQYSGQLLCIGTVSILFLSAVYDYNVNVCKFVLSVCNKCYTITQVVDTIDIPSLSL